MNSGGTAGAVFCPVGFGDEHAAADRTAFQGLIPENLRFQRSVQRQDRPAEPLTADEKETVCGQVQVSPSSRTMQLPSSQQLHSRRIRLAACFLCAVSCGKENRPACVPAAASLYRGYLSCVPSILLSVAVLPKSSCPFLRRVPNVGTLPAASGHFVRSPAPCGASPARGIPFWTVILFSRCCPSMNYPKSTPK